MAVSRISAGRQTLDGLLTALKSVTVRHGALRLAVI
jgi:hypothetical protein